jgi:tRNA 2-selenouridine synthase SelU
MKIWEAKRSEKIEAKRSEMKRKKLVLCFRLSMQNKPKRILFRLISLRSEKIFYAKPAHPTGYRFGVHKLKNMDESLVT